MTNKPFYLIMLSGLLFFLALVAFVGIKSNDETAQPPVEETAFDPAGAYAASCVACHGGNLEGGMGPSLVGLALTAEEVADIIQNGRPPSDKYPTGMPAGVFKGSEEDRLALANWILEHK